MLVDGIPPLAAVLLLLASAFVARELGRAHPVRIVSQLVVGGGFGGLPAALLFNACKRFRPDFGFIWMMFGFAVGVPLGALGATVAGRALAGRRVAVPAVVGSLVGAFAGTFLAFLTVCARARDFDTEPPVLVVAALLVGSFATLGHQLTTPRPPRAETKHPSGAPPSA